MNLIHKINKWTGWLSLLFIALFTLTGFAMAGMWGLDGIIGVRRANMLHTSPYTVYPMLIVVIVHTLTSMKRWIARWKKKS